MKDKERERKPEWMQRHGAAYIFLTRLPNFL